MASPSAADVKRFYDENTRLLLGLGQGTEGTIHRAVWGPGISDRVSAMRYVEDLVTEQIGALGIDGGPHIVDLGCGIGASLCRVVARTAGSGLGITISDKQVALGTAWIEQQGQTGQVRCIEGDFCALPPGLRSADLAYAVESFVHAPSAERFFQQASTLVKRGGRLVVCDDFAARAPGGAREERWKLRFTRGWVLGSLVTETGADTLARAAGFEPLQTVDLSDYLELGRPRDYAIAALMRTLGWLPIVGSYWSMLYGGHALQVCLLRGYVKHLFKVWRRV